MVSRLVDQEDLDRIDAAIQRAEATEPEIERARLAGIDVSQAEQRLRDNLSRLRAMRAAFFPAA